MAMDDNILTRNQDLEKKVGIEWDKIDFYLFSSNRIVMF